MKVTRRLVLGALAAVPAGAAFGADAEADWPVRPVRIVSPYAAGGANDISARILAEHIGQNLKQQFVIENKAGAGTRIAGDDAPQSLFAQGRGLRIERATLGRGDAEHTQLAILDEGQRGGDGGDRCIDVAGEQL